MVDGFEIGMHRLDQLRPPGSSIAQDKKAWSQSKEGVRSFLKHTEIVQRMQDVEYRTLIQTQILDDFIESKGTVCLRHQC